MRYLDHKRPLYLVASINQTPIKSALVDTGTSVNLIPLSMWQAVRILENKIQGCPMEVTRFGGRDEYIAGHIAMAEGGPNSLFSPLPCSKDKRFLSCTVEKTMGT